MNGIERPRATRENTWDRDLRTNTNATFTPSSVAMTAESVKLYYAAHRRKLLATK
jgi:hypothetical protein